MFIKIEEFLYFYDCSLRADHSYHKVRSELWSTFLDAFATFAVPNAIPINSTTFNQVKTYLCSKNDMSNLDDKRLAFEAAVNEIMNRVKTTFKVSVKKSRFKPVTFDPQQIVELPEESKAPDRSSSVGKEEL